MADLQFTVRRGAYGYDWEWFGGAVLAKAIGASLAAINESMAIGVELAKAGHPDYPPVGNPRFASREGEQLVDSIKILDRAESHGWAAFDAAIANGTPALIARGNIWCSGEWGIEGREVTQDPDIWSGRWPGMKPRFKRPAVGEVNATTLERAIWTEFGTGPHGPGGIGGQSPRPFLYPAWDISKALMPALVREAFALGLGQNTPAGWFRG